MTASIRSMRIERDAATGDIERALDMAVRYGGTDGAHHKAWVIDQMVRALTRCPVTAAGAFGESDEYRALVASARAGEDGPETYDWDTGIAL